MKHISDNKKYGDDYLLCEDWWLGCLNAPLYIKKPTPKEWDEEQSLRQRYTKTNRLYDHM